MVDEAVVHPFEPIAAVARGPPPYRGNPASGRSIRALLSSAIRSDWSRRMSCSASGTNDSPPLASTHEVSVSIHSSSPCPEMKAWNGTPGPPWAEIGSALAEYRRQQRCRRKLQRRLPRHQIHPLEPDYRSRWTGRVRARKRSRRVLRPTPSAPSPKRAVACSPGPRYSGLRLSPPVPARRDGFAFAVVPPAVPGSGPGAPGRASRPCVSLARRGRHAVSPALPVDLLLCVVYHGRP